MLEKQLNVVSRTTLHEQAPTQHVTSPRNAPFSYLIIGYGSDLRGDDAAGRAAAETLEAMDLPETMVLSVHQLTPELSPLLAQANVAVFLDACADGDKPVAVSRLAPAATRHSAGHIAAPDSLLLLTEAIYGHAPVAWMVTIPGDDFTLGASLSAHARAGVAAAVGIVQHLLENSRSADSSVVLRKGGSRAAPTKPAEEARSTVM